VKPAQSWTVTNSASGSNSPPVKENQSQLAILDHLSLSSSQTTRKGIKNCGAASSEKPTVYPEKPTLYHQQTKRPLICLLFVLPFILIYEVSNLMLQGSNIRSGMDRWLVHFLEIFGLGEVILLPLLTAGILLLAHHRHNDSWRIRPGILGGMLVESVGLGLILFFAAKAIYLVSQPIPSEVVASTWREPLWWSQTIAVVGSGIYEELIFRMVLLTLFIEWLFRRTGRQHIYWVAIALISLLFVGLHYDFLNPVGSQFDLFSFLFRYFASVIFSLLFLFRGFGIAVGAHIAFDILTQL
jgi:membrane protease YdiL (CAAX protease family)